MIKVYIKNIAYRTTGEPLECIVSIYPKIREKFPHSFDKPHRPVPKNVSRLRFYPERFVCLKCALWLLPYALIIWQMADRYAQGMFGSKYGDTSILDADYQPKPAYYAILNELKM